MVIGTLLLPLALVAAGAAAPAPAAPAKPASPNVATLFNQGKFAEALQKAQAVLEKDARNPGALYYAGASANRLQKFAEAEKYLTTCREVKPDQPWLDFEMGLLNLNRAEAMVKEGQADPAKPMYEKAGEFFQAEAAKQAANPQAALQMHQLASTAMVKSGNWARAIPVLQGWMAADPAATQPKENLLLGYLETEKYAEASELATHIQGKGPEIAKGFYNRALKLFYTEKTEQAVPLVEKAVELDPAFAAPHGLLTMIRLQQGQVGSAWIQFSAFMDLNPTPEEQEKVGDYVASFLEKGPDGGAEIKGEPQPPILTFKNAPNYPQAAVEKKIGTNVIVLIDVAADGKTSNARTIRTTASKWNEGLGFELSAIEAANKSTYKAGTKDGAPAALPLAVRIDFRPRV